MFLKIFSLNGMDWKKETRDKTNLKTQIKWLTKCMVYSTFVQYFANIVANSQARYKF